MFNDETLKAVREEVISSFTSEEIKLLNNFDAFFDLVDVQNTYEDGWEELKETYRPYYQKIWLELVAGGNHEMPNL